MVAGARRTRLGPGHLTDAALCVKTQGSIVDELDRLRRPTVLKHHLHFFDMTLHPPPAGRGKEGSRLSPVFFSMVREPFERFHSKYNYLRQLEYVSKWDS